MTRLIDALRSKQQQRGWLAPEDLSELAAELLVPLYRLEELVSFYPEFRREPKTSVEVGVCQDLSCHLAGSVETRSAFERIAAQSDGALRVHGVSCLGRCETPTAVSLNSTIYTRVNAGRASALAAKALAGPMRQERRVQGEKPPLKIDPYGDGPGQRALRRLVSTEDFDTVVEQLKSSGLRGMGGAGFPTGSKWEFVRRAEGEPKVVICNADESEPGTFKDRVLLERVPELVVEGLLIAALTVGASRAVIYIRHEYHREAEGLRRVLKAFARQGLTGPDILGSGMGCTVELFVSPGGYICGEETALLEALEDRRAEPREKPPFPATAGLHGRPTLINNVETLAMVPAILLRGPDWFRQQGSSEFPGLKFMALSGHVRRPGVYEVPLGLSARELIEQYGSGLPRGKRLKAFAPGGASSGFLPASLADTPLAFEPLAGLGSMLGSGAMVALAEPTCMLDLALNTLRFFRNESCGKCVPCRNGTDKLTTLLEALSDGRGRAEDLRLVEELAETMRDASICGLGQAAPNPITSVLQHFPEEIQDHLRRRHCPSGVCFGGKSRD